MTTYANTFMHYSCINITTNAVKIWYQHQPNNVEENDDMKILWNFPIRTDHNICHNKPDIVVVDKTSQTAAIIDIAIPNDYNIV